MAGYAIEPYTALQISARLQQEQDMLQQLLNNANDERVALLAGFWGDSSAAYGQANVKWAEGQARMNAGLLQLRELLDHNTKSYMITDAQGSDLFRF